MLSTHSAHIHAHAAVFNGQETRHLFGSGRALLHCQPQVYLDHRSKQITYFWVWCVVGHKVLITLAEARSRTIQTGNIESCTNSSFIAQQESLYGLKARMGVQVYTGKLSLVDLAGSERASETNNCGRQLKDGASINRYGAEVTCIFDVAVPTNPTRRAHCLQHTICSKIGCWLHAYVSGILPLHFAETCPYPNTAAGKTLPVHNPQCLQKETATLPNCDF